jgi:hypothetical protein
MIFSRLYVLLCLTGLTKAWMPTKGRSSSLRFFPLTTSTRATRFEKWVYMDASTETAVDDRYYSVPPTQPQVLVNSKPRVTLTRFLSNIVKENPEVRTYMNAMEKFHLHLSFALMARPFFARLAIWNHCSCRFKWRARQLVIL